MRGGGAVLRLTGLSPLKLTPYHHPAPGLRLSLEAKAQHLSPGTPPPAHRRPPRGRSSSSSPRSPPPPPRGLLWVPLAPAGCLGSGAKAAIAGPCKLDGAPSGGDAVGPQRSHPSSLRVGRQPLGPRHGGGGQAEAGRTFPAAGEVWDRQGSGGPLLHLFLTLPAPIAQGETEAGAWSWTVRPRTPTPPHAFLAGVFQGSPSEEPPKSCNITAAPRNKVMPLGWAAPQGG